MMTKWMTVLVISLRLSCALVAQDAALKIDAFATPRSSMETEAQRHVHVCIKNVGETTVVLPTANIGPAKAIKGNYIRLGFRIVDRTLADGKRAIQSRYSFEPVELKKGQSTIIICELPIPDFDTIDVAYEIDEETAHQYGFVACRLKTVAHEHSFYLLNRAQEK